MATWDKERDVEALLESVTRTASWSKSLLTGSGGSTFKESTRTATPLFIRFWDTRSVKLWVPTHFPLYTLMMNNLPGRC